MEAGGGPGWTRVDLIHPSRLIARYKLAKAQALNTRSVLDVTYFARPYLVTITK
jgi:hypothetical protein